MRFPILAGPLRGQWWLLASRGQPGRVLTGSYEREHSELFDRWIEPGADVIDVGAHVGYYTLLAVNCTGPRGRVWAFEPDPRNCTYLRRHVAINHLENAEVVEAAVADRDGSEPFRFGSGSGTGCISTEGTIDVRICSLDAFCENRAIEPAFLKVDAEGAEVRVLRGAAELLRRFRPLIVLSTHGPALHRECVDLLRHFGYRFDPITGSDPDRTSELFCQPIRSMARGQSA